MHLKDYFLLFFSGVVIGIANIIPGVSGGTIAVCLGVYERILDAIGNFFKNIKKNILFLLPILLGGAAGILASSKLISICLDKYKAQTIFLFVGLIFGGLSIIMKKTKNNYKTSNIMIFLLVFIGVIGLNLIVPTPKNITFDNLKVIDYLILVGVGALAAGTMVIPGISGSFVLMLIGYYEPIINVVSDITNFSHFGHNISILLPFGIGVIIGIILIAKLITYCFKKNETKSYFAILGFVLSSIVILIMQIDTFTYDFKNIFTCILTLLWGYLLTHNFIKE